MNLVEYKPSRMLTPYIECYRVISSDNGSINRILPSTSVALAFRLDGMISERNGEEYTLLPSVVVSGLRKSARMISYHRSSRALIVLFKPGRAHLLLNTPLHHLFETSLSLSEFFPPSEISRIEELLHFAKDDVARVNLIEQFLQSKLFPSQEDMLVNEAIRLIENSYGLLRIRELCRTLCISQDAFEKRFRRITGATPKRYCSVVRMRAIVQRKSAASFMDLVADHGYHDQSHFNKEFKTFTGLAPTQFFKSASAW